VLATYHPHIWLSQQRLAEDLKMSRRYVNELLLALERAAVIERIRRGRLSTVYRLNLETIRACSVPAEDSRCEPGTSDVVIGGSQEYQEEEIKEGSLKDPSDVYDPFEPDPLWRPRGDGVPGLRSVARVGRRVDVT
jgi:hypothetical protein